MTAILLLLKQYLNFIIYGVIIGVTIYCCHLYYNGKVEKLNKKFKDYENQVVLDIEKSKTNLLTQQNELQEENIILNKKIKEKENENFKQYAQLQKANDTIKSNLSAGTQRLYVKASCPTTTSSNSGETKNRPTSGLDNGTTSKIELDTRTSQSLVEITSKGDKYKTQLEACQSFVSDITK